MEDLEIRGNFAESSLPQFLRSVCNNKESGILTCNLDVFQKAIYINEGHIIFASSNNPDDRLGEVLLRYGKITVRQYMEASKVVRPGKRLGSVLCDNKAITPEELVEGIRLQIRDIIRSLFEVTSGTYELVLKPIDTQEMILLNMTTEDIIFDGVKSIDSWSRISKGIGSFGSKVLPSVDSDKVMMNLTVSGDEAHVLSLCSKGQFTVEEICGLSYLTNFDTCRIIWSFLMAGALQQLEFAPEMSSTTSSTGFIATSFDLEYDLHDLVENYNDLFAHIFDYAYTRIGEDAEMMSGKAMTLVQDSMPEVARNLKLDAYGRLDFDTVLMNLHPVPEQNRKVLLNATLEEIVYALLFQIGSQFGSADQSRLTSEIQAMRKA
jgi:hypothetical protein